MHAFLFHLIHAHTYMAYWEVALPISFTFCLITGLVVGVMGEDSGMGAGFGFIALMVAVIVNAVAVTAYNPRQAVMATPRDGIRALLIQRLDQHRQDFGFRPVLDPQIPQVSPDRILRSVFLHRPVDQSGWIVSAVALAPAQWQWDPTLAQQTALNPPEEALSGRQFAVLAASADLHQLVHQWVQTSRSSTTLLDASRVGISIVPVTPGQASTLEDHNTALDAPYPWYTSFHSMALYVLWVPKGVAGAGE